MISLTKIFDLLGNDTSVIIRYEETKLYSGSVGKSQGIYGETHILKIWDLATI